VPPTEHDQILDDFACNLIKRKARRLARRPGFSHEDIEDIEQELALKLWESRSAFRPEKGSHEAFVTVVVNRAVSNILRERAAAKRDHRRVTSLNTKVPGGPESPGDLGSSLAQDAHDARLGSSPRSPEERADLAFDVAEQLDSLPEGQRDLAERLKSQTVSEAAREMGVPRTTVQDAARRLRQPFEDAGLREYL
jgi:RNA polymerase sigma factor (sigma-70 family)